MEINDITVRLDRVVKTYGDAVTGVRAVDGVSLTLPVGSFTAIMGPSGSGKSTLVQCAAGLLPVDDGEVTVGGARITGLNDRRLTRWRRQHVGFVFQGYNLVPYLTAAENVALPMRLARGRVDRAAVADALARVGLADRADHLPAELSGGQAQRVAVARALVTRPAVVLADEPTGALDTVSAREVLRLLRDSVDQLGQTVVMVTHDPVAASHADEVVYLVDGRVVGTMRNPSADAVASQLAHLDDLVTTGAHR